MKYFFLLGLLLSIQVGFAQSEAKITLQKEKVTFKEIISSLEKQSGYLFSWDASLVLNTPTYSLKANQENIDAVLQRFLSPLQLQYKKIGNQVVISKKEIKKKYTISGIIKEKATGETIIGATIRLKETGYGTRTNAYGFFSLTVDEDEYHLAVTYLGMESYEQAISLHDNKEMNIAMVKNDQGVSLKEVKIRSNKTSVKEFTSSTDMGRIEIPIAMMKKVPTIAGESDILKVVQLTPGVKRGGEGSIGMYVRGGGADENLILLDEATVYNVGHLLGFFSVFNTNSIKDVTLHKGGFPAEFGGRLSSVLDIRMKEGNNQSYHAEGSIGMVASNLTIQGPIKKNKGSFIVSGRRTYIDKLFSLIKVPLPYYFYDLNVKGNYMITNRDKLFISSYYGNDVLDLDKLSADSGDALETQLGSQIGNFTTTLRWNHQFTNRKWFMNTSLIQTRFRYNVKGGTANEFLKLESRIQDYGVKTDVNFAPNPKNQIKIGLQYLNHTFKPNTFSSSIQDTVVSIITSANRLINTHEMGVYAMNDQTVSDRLKVNYGLRFSGTLTEAKFYGNIEPRINLRYQLNEHHSIKASYTRMSQYLHLVSSSSVALPTDLWYPVTKTIKPLYSDQVSLGYYTGIEKTKTLISAEVYYKKMRNSVEYKEGAMLLLNNNFEKELVRGSGEAYGLEVFINKTSGRFTGWIGYTLSYATRQFDSLNKGKTFWAKYDRRHDISFVAMYDITKRLSVSAVWVYATGSPFTARVGQYILPNPGYNGVITVPVYSDRNAYRLSDSHRLDIDFCLKRKPTRKWQGEWHFSAYNAYNRTQPSRVRIRLVDGTYKYQQTGLFGIIPSIAYNFKF